MAPHMPHGAPFALLAAQIDVWSSPSPPHPPMCICCHLCLIGTPIDVWFPPSYPHPIRCAHFDTNDKRSGQKVPVSSSLPSPHNFFYNEQNNWQPKGTLVLRAKVKYIRAHPPLLTGPLAGLRRCLIPLFGRLRGFPSQTATWTMTDHPIVRYRDTSEMQVTCTGFRYIVVMDSVT